jgi:HD-GYP domain-containing protein (c-di-GMP phosphodiesterase class II)
MGLSHHECEELYMTGLLHDIGKIGVPDGVLSKPGKLTEAEFAQIRLHPEIGYQILKNLTPLDYALPGVLHHHEAVDGSGYPYGLSGDEIPLYARVLAVGDAYDAMTSDRPYRGGMDSEKAEAILRSGAGQQWDARAVNAFFAVATEIRAIAARSKACAPNPLEIGVPDGDLFGDSIATAVAETHA